MDSIKYLDPVRRRYSETNKVGIEIGISTDARASPIRYTVVARNQRARLISNHEKNKMRTKRIYIILIVIGLLAVLTTTVYATTNRHPATPSIVGTWKIVMPKSEGNPDASENLQTFFADGNFVETTSLLGHGKEGPDHGVWIGGSGNTYYWTAQLFLFDEESGDHTGTLKRTVPLRSKWMTQIISPARPWRILSIWTVM